MTFAFVFTRLHEARSGDICNACVLLVKRWKKLPAGSKKNWNHVSNAFLFCPKTNSLWRGKVLAGVWGLLFCPHSPLPPSASLNPSWSIYNYIAPTCLCAYGDYATLRCSHRVIYLVIPCFHKLINLSKSLLWHSGKKIKIQDWPLSKIGYFFFFSQAKWFAQATHKSISFNQIIAMTNILQLFSLIYSVLIGLI